MTDINSLPFHLQLLVREYGQSTYELIQSLRGIEDVAERSKRAHGIVQLMLRLQPSLREQPDIQTTLWNHVHALAGEDVALEAPVPLRPVADRSAPPMKVMYPVQGPKLRTYGQAVEGLIAKAAALEDAAEREQAAIQIGRTMKFLYRQHNKENAKDVTIIRHLAELSGGQLKLDAQTVADQGLFEITALPPPAPVSSSARPATSQPSGRFEGRPDRERRPERPDRADRPEGNGNGKKRDKKRGKKFRSEPQQPPQ